MGREIKFRGKRADNGEWVYGDLLRVGGGCIIYFGSMTETATPDIPNSSPVAVELFNDEIAVVFPDTVGQYTGVDDVNGNPIFEGDIISLADWIKPCEVIWNNDGASFKIRYIIEDGFCIPKDAFGHWVQDHKDSVCVIGNRFDNPSLLK